MRAARGLQALRFGDQSDDDSNSADSEESFSIITESNDLSSAMI